MKKKKILNCPVCKAEIPFKTKNCPSCGAKIKKPRYKKYFLGIALFVLILSAFWIGTHQTYFQRQTAPDQIPSPQTAPNQSAANQTEPKQNSLNQTKTEAASPSGIDPVLFDQKVKEAVSAMDTNGIVKKIETRTSGGSGYVDAYLSSMIYWYAASESAKKDFIGSAGRQINVIAQ